MFAKFRAVRDPGWNTWATGGDFAPGSLTRPTASTASQLMTVYGCVTRIADVMATMPVDHYTKSGEVRREASPRASWLDQPNAEMDWQAFMTQVMWSWLIDGNVFLMPIRSDAGRVVEVWCLDPSTVQLRRTGGRVETTVAGRAFAGEMVILRAYTRPGELRGLNPIDNARTALGLGLAAQEYGGSFLGNNAVPPLVIRTKGGPLTPAQAKDLREAWGDNHAGPRNAGKVGVLTGDAEIQLLSVTPEQAQFLETRRFSASEISSNLFHVPPQFVGVAIEGSGSLTYQTIADQWDDFIRSACMRWMTHFEKAVSWQFLPRPQYIKFNADAYLRPSTKTRYETHAIGIGAGFLLPDEARGYEEMGPLSPAPGGGA